MSLLLVLFFASIAAGLALTPLVRYGAIALGVIDKPCERKVHETPTPRMGGLAIALCFYAGLFVAWKIGIFHYTEKFRGILYGSIIILLTGIIDDITGIRPKYKLLVQCLSALVFLYYGSKITVFIKNDIVNNIVTFAWVVVITNSFNLLDNMDGLSGGVAMICSLIFFYVAFRQHQPALMVISLLLAGSILGFMRYNYSPASIFMGDTGSLFIGFLLAAISTECTYLVDSRLTRLPIVTPLMVLSVGETAHAYALTPAHMKRLVQSLSHQVEEYEKKFGAIQAKWAPGIESPIQSKDIGGSGE